MSEDEDADVRSLGGARDIGDRPQTLATIGLYYTVLGLDTFGTVDWRHDAER